MIIQIFVIILFITVGIIFSMGRGEFLIPGYNALSQEEKEKLDTVALCKFLGKVMFALAFLISFFPLSEILQIKALYYIGLALNLIGIIFILNYLNKRRKR